MIDSMPIMNLEREEQSKEKSPETQATKETDLHKIDSKKTEVHKVPDSDEDFFSATPEGLTSVVPESSSVPTVETLPEEPEPVDTSGWRIVTSNLSLSGRAALPKFLSLVGQRGQHPKVEKGVTHVVVSTSPDREAQRTLKYLQAVASGLLVVSELWMEACLKNSGALSDAASWEVTDEELGGSNGPWAARQARLSSRPPLFKGFQVFVSGELEGLDRPAVEDLISRTGAKCVADSTAFSFSPSVVRLVLVDSVVGTQGPQQARMLKNMRIATVDKDWLLDSICSHSIRPIYPNHVMEGVNRQDLVRAGYKAPLLPDET